MKSINMTRQDLVVGEIYYHNDGNGWISEFLGIKTYVQTYSITVDNNLKVETNYIGNINWGNLKSF